MLYWKEKFGRLPEGLDCLFEWMDAWHPPHCLLLRRCVSPSQGLDPHVYQLGYWFPQGLEEYAPSQALSAFLEQGEKPIYFGFGSVFSGEEQGVFLRYVTETLAQTGKRGLLCGMGKIENRPKNLFAIESAPHAWLFPKCLAVCHHGGARLRAGEGQGEWFSQNLSG